MILHVITACSRPDNLPAVGESIREATRPGCHVHWHIVYDLERRAIGGQAPKNRALDAIDDGWVFVLDDDTLMHPNLIDTLQAHQDADAIVVSQERTNGHVLHAARENIAVARIDAGQALIRRSLIGLNRFPEMYCGDGLFFEVVLLHAVNVVFVDQVLSWHNRLERVAA